MVCMHLCNRLNAPLYACILLQDARTSPAQFAFAQTLSITIHPHPSFDAVHSAVAPSPRLQDAHPLPFPRKTGSSICSCSEQ